MSKNKDRIKVSFGHNAENVTGSYTLIECGATGKKILVDFGLIQENGSTLKEYQENLKRPKFKPKSLDYVFISHSHSDHLNRTPLLVKWGSEAPIIVPQGSKSINKEMLLDCAKIMGKDAESISRKMKKEYEPIYTADDVNRTVKYMKEYPVGEKIKLDDDITFQFNYTGHIFKACSVTLWIKNGNQTRKIIVTGDIGNIAVPQKYCEDFVPFESCNLLVSECTYSDESRTTGMKQRVKDLEKIKACIQTACIDNHGSVLMPVFAFGRSPTMLTFLYDIFYEDSMNGKFDIPIVYASPLGSKLLKIYEEELEGEQKEELQKVLEWKNIRILDNFEQLEAEIRELKPKIYLAPSGMMNAGSSIYIASKILPSSKNFIIFSGYAAEGTLAYKIKQKKTKTISIDGVPVPARCNIINLTSFSSHVQYPELMKMLTGEMGGSNACFDKIALVHSNYKSKVEFGNKLQEECEKRNKNTKVTIVNNGTSISI